MILKYRDNVISAEKYIAGKGLSLDKNVFSVNVPNVVMSKSEYDSMTEEEKQADVLYIVPDSYVVTSPSGEVYSTEETRIGTWIDGKPLYRKVLELTTPNTINMDEIIYKFDGIDIKQMHGYIGYLGLDNKGYANLPFVYDSDHATIWIYNNYLFWRKTSTTLFQNGTITLIIEYTKATG